MCVCLWVCAYEYRCSQRPKVSDSPEAVVVTCFCKSSGVGFQFQAEVLWQNSVCSVRSELSLQIAIKIFYNAQFFSVKVLQHFFNYVTINNRNNHSNIILLILPLLICIMHIYKTYCFKQSPRSTAYFIYFQIPNASFFIRHTF